MTIRLKLPGGTLKFKSGDNLRRRERKRMVPVWQIGGCYVIWWPDSMPSGPSRPHGGASSTAEAHPV